MKHRHECEIPARRSRATDLVDRLDDDAKPWTLSGLAKAMLFCIANECSCVEVVGIGTKSCKD